MRTVCSALPATYVGTYLPIPWDLSYSHAVRFHRDIYLVFFLFFIAHKTPTGRENQDETKTKTKQPSINSGNLAMFHVHVPIRRPHWLLGAHTQLIHKLSNYRLPCLSGLIPWRFSGAGFPTCVLRITVRMDRNT